MRRYAVIIEKANGNYSAYVPDLPGCVATGKTLAQVERNIHSAICLHLAELGKTKAHIPPPTTTCKYVEA